MQTTSAQPAYALQPAGFTASLPGKLVLGLAATVAVALAAHVSFPLPFTLIPLTLQPLAVLGVGLAFGPVEAFFIMLAYLAEGAAGLPVFSPQGTGGIAQLIGPTGGYLMSYPLVAALASTVVRALRNRVPAFAAAAAACTASVVLLYTCGAGWLMSLTHLPVAAALSKGVLPFLPGEAVKILAASGIFRALVRRRNV